jgi:rhodanese-related sulfurtransferase
MAASAAVILAAGAEKAEAGATGVFDRIRAATPEKDGVREIGYDRFMEIRKSGDEFVVLDVLAEDSFREGHIEGAKNFPVGGMTKESAEKMLKKDARVVVYCGSFLCTASTAAAKKLGALGYTILDYKGGLKEWKEKGNALAK